MATVTLQPDPSTGKDAFVESGSSINSNFGTNVSLVAGDNGGADNRIYIQFDLSGIIGTITSAQLQLYCSGTSGGGHNIDLHQVTSPWTENGITWATQPSYNPTKETTVFVSDNNKWYSWDITALVKKWVEDGVPNYGVTLKRDVEDTSDSIRRSFRSSDFTTDPTLRPKLVITYTPNTAPSIALTSPTNNLVLAEGNTVQVEGSATDQDVNDPVTIYLQINNGTPVAIHSGVSDGSTAIYFAKQLEYRNKRVYYGTTDLTGADLAENTNHTLKVWAEDNKGGKSAEVTRQFQVRHNKPPVLTVDAFTPVQSGLIPPDLIALTGTVSEPNGNTVTVTGQVNDGQPEVLLEGVSDGPWSFSFPVSQLKEGDNTVTIKATDQFGSSTVKTFNVNNAVTKTPLTKGVARYKVIPPIGAAKEILAWLQREIGDLSVDGAASFVDAGQPEQYTAMTKSSIDLAYGIAEDELIGSVVDPKADIVFKQTFTRANPESSESAVKLVGVIE